ncbi:MAG: NupC/NupG family nucleoside CNT transporter [Candidatus Aminicenantes bacterium]|nr:NupC/NupG family nucleoside CNT transporter [Candidatus Aminicenantes bacterium]
MEKVLSVTGIFVFLLIAFALSSNRKAIPWKTVLISLLLQFLTALFMLKTSVGIKLFEIFNRIFLAFLSYSDKGAEFLFGKLVHDTNIGAIVAFKVLPVIIFVSSFMAVLAYLRIIEYTIKILAHIFYRTMGISGAEAFASSLFIFMGIETITGLKEYIEEMTDSEIFLVMTAFLATIAGSVMATYVSFGASAGHLMAASLMSAPAAVALSKIMVPETETPKTAYDIKSVKYKRHRGNLVSAAANGASDGLALSLQIAAMLIAFVAMIYMVDSWLKPTGITLEKLLGWTFSPFAVLMGIPPKEAVDVGVLLGTKTVFNEFLAYLQLHSHIVNHTLSQRAIVISSYALCGFANFGSIAIMIGGIGTLAPSKKEFVTRLSIKALIAGTLASFMTASFASILL